MTGRRVAVLVLSSVLALGACGDHVDLAPRAQRQLQPVLDDVRAAAIAADRLGARSALRELERAVTALTDAGQISEERAAEILAAAEAVADQLTLLPAPSPSPTPEPTVSPIPEPSEEAEESGGSEDPGNGQGNAYGHNKDEDKND